MMKVSAESDSTVISPMPCSRKLQFEMFSQEESGFLDSDFIAVPKDFCTDSDMPEAKLAMQVIL